MLELNSPERVMLGAISRHEAIDLSIENVELIADLAGLGLVRYAGTDILITEDGRAVLDGVWVTSP